MMRKVIFTLFILLGSSIIATRIFLQLEPTKEDKKNKEKTELETFQRINTYNLEETCTTNDFVNTYIETVTFAKINFNYPNCVHEYDLNESFKLLQNEDESISITVSKENNTLKSYMDEQKNKIVSYKNKSDYQNLTYTDVVNLTTQNNIKVSFIEYNYQYDKSKYDSWHISAQIADSYLVTFDIKSKDKIVSYAVIKRLINSIELEQNAAKFINSTIKGDYQIGYLRQNFHNSYKHGVKLKYQVPTTYKEVESVSTNYDQSSFEYQAKEKDFLVTISLDKTVGNKTIKEEIESLNNSVITSYKPKNETYQNNESTGVIEQNIKGKDVYYFIYSYDYKSQNETKTSYEIAYVYYKITENFFYKVYINNRNYPITENFISQFLDFTIEEY